jgi:hypothetical protein
MRAERVANLREQCIQDSAGTGFACIFTAVYQGVNAL